MTDTITPASLRAHAVWMERFLHDSKRHAEYLRYSAARLEAESARDQYVDQLAEVYRVAFKAAAGDSYIADGSWTAAGVRAVLDRLAADGRLLPEGGTVLTAEQSDDVRQYLRSHDLAVGMRLRTIFDPIEPSDCGCGKSEACDRVLCPLIDTPPAVSVPLELPTEPGSRIRASVKRWGSAREWADTDPYVDTFTLGERDIWHAENDCLVVGAWNREYITVLEVLPAASAPDSGPDGTPEKPWKRWQDVPEGVVYRSEKWPNGRWVNRPDGRYLKQLGGAEIPSIASEKSLRESAPFVRVDGDK
ncbi:hypothetical protein A6F55_19150 [Prescottella equi]|uniref:hypothetical protein n=1 Tax=Rhodococcus hoagii TaxID=43767 RepID=UPI000A10942A|nr:hypothetical protein [Prescottella equi]ORL01811.1 hypothetical protein A6F55_19150 [Prescottella equi]